MAMFKFRDCLASEVATQPIVNGTFIVCRDTGDMYCDTIAGERVTIAKTIHLVQGNVNTELYPEDGHIYYSVTDRQVCVYHDGEFQPINVATCFKKIENCYVAKSDESEFIINGQVGNDRIDAVYGGSIINIIPYKLYTDLAIYDLDTTLVANGSVAFNGVSRSEDGVWSVKVKNDNTTTNWLGSVNVLLFMTNDYHSQHA